MNILNSTNKQKTICSVINKNTGKNICKNELIFISSKNYNDYFSHKADKLLNQIPTSNAKHVKYLENSSKSSDIIFSLSSSGNRSLEGIRVIKKLQSH